MSEGPFQAKAYLKRGCPYSFKLLLFLSEAGLLEQFELVHCDPADARFAQIKAELAQATGREATFPTVEIEPGRYQSDSDRLVELYANRHQVRPETLPAFAFYAHSIFPQLAQQHGSG